MTAHDVEDIYVLSPMQEGLLFYTLQNPRSSMYAQQLAHTYVGDLDEEALRSAWQVVVGRHPVLRSSFVWERLDKPLQMVHREAPVEFETLDWSGLSAEELVERERRLLRDDRERGFDLAAPPLMRFYLARLDDRRHRFVVSVHHLVLDGWSTGVVLKEVAAAYTAMREGKPVDLPSARPFRAYVDWLRAKDPDSAEAYWRRELKGVTGPTPLPVADAAHRAGLGEQQVAAVELGARESSRLTDLLRERRLTLNTLVQAAWALLLSRYAGTPEAVFGTVSSGRPPELEGSEEMVGLFVNTLPIRVRVDPAAHVGEWLDEVQAKSVAARAHEHVPLTRIQEWSDVPHGTELFESVQVVQNALDLSLLWERFADLEVADPVYFTRTSFPLTLTVVPGDRILLRAMYDASWLPDTMAGRLLGHLKTLLGELAGDPGRRLADLPMLTPEEWTALVGPGGGRADEAPWPVGQECAEHGAHRPDAVAVTHGARSLSWGQLDTGVERLAARLRERGAAENTVVALCLRDPVDALTALLAVWRAGAAPAPLDPARPAADLLHLAEAARPGLMVADPETAEALADTGHELLLLDPEAGALPAPVDSPVRPPAPVETALAYVAFTSGAEDGPKAVPLDHRSLTATGGVHREELHLRPDDTVLLHAPADSYLYLLTVLAGLRAGARFVLPTGSAAESSSAVTAAIEAQVAEYGVSCAVLTPTLLGALDPEGPAGALRTVIVTGEHCPAPVAAAWARDTGRRVFSLYGSAETAGAAVLGRVTPEGATEGRPVGGRRAYVLGAGGSPLPCGVAGELHLAGPGLSPGYLDRPALTVERYRPDPFFQDAPERMYRTGDLARWTESGGLEVLGRVGERLTVAGRAVDPAAVAELLRTHPAVAACTVGGDDDGLTAYVVPDHEGSSGADADEQVHQWRQLYEHTYADQNGTGEAEFNTVGWNSSFTGGAIPEDEMREWRTATLEQLRGLRASSVLEIGCGTGMFLLPLARECEEYWATDLSPAALDYVREQLRAPAYADSRVTLREQQADDLTGIPSGRFDLVVINSVVQYFPDEAYLRRVLDGAVRALRPGGRIFVGDVRNLDTLRAMHLSMQLADRPADHPAPELWLAARSRARLEEELVLSPGFFRGYAAQLAPGAVARVAAKRGRARNELTCYRYDVLIEPAGGESGRAGRVLDWASDIGEPDALAGLLAEEPDTLLIGGVPDARVRDMVAAVELLDRDAAPATAGGLAERVSREAGVDPEALHEAAERAGYQVDLLLGEAPATLDALFVRNGSPAAAPEARAGQWRAHAEGLPPVEGRVANDPLAQRHDTRLLGELQTLAERRLPSHAVPGDYLVVADLPLTRDGRTARGPLGSLRGSGRGPGREITAPRDTTELVVARVWEEVLGIRPVGVTDDFFSLGGHSLVAMRVISRLQRHFNRDIDLAVLLNQPTVAELAAVLRAEAEGPGRSSVVTLQAAGEEPPLFLVHPSGGNLLVYQFLAERLGADTPVHMLETPALHRFGTVEELAAHYAEAIRQFVPHGPYRLGGLSFGGLVAFEVARQLTEAGEKVEAVTMFESSLAGAVPKDVTPEDLLAYRTAHFAHVFELVFGKEIPLTEEELRGLAPDEQLEMLYQRVDASLGGGLGMGILRSTVEDVQRVRDMIRAYRPGDYSGPVHLFIGLEPMPPHLNDPEFYRSDRTLGWDEHLPDLRIVDTPGNHLTLLNPPHVDTLAERMREITGSARTREAR
ncbi:thioesterase domain-containing protein [Streptomyces sp. TP-A0874]|uniref:thioesterase domain-containing protein n=1 Tax=Streptomyces sp. TP-A0874 TaxID=549819 RepID=UPI0008530481|nr:condensation domain-containing protein [Streptomyces sp. TP-A0874]